MGMKKWEEKEMQLIKGVNKSEFPDFLNINFLKKLDDAFWSNLTRWVRELG